MLTFATGGTAAQVPPSGAAAGGILFDTANNFALTAASDGTLSIGAGGLTLANRAVQSGATWRMHDLDLPVVVAADQTWDMSTVGNGGSGQRLRVRGNIQGAAGRTLTITGKGCLSLYATNDFAGTVELAGGVTKTFSMLRPFGSAAEGGEIVIDQAKKGRLEMWACVIDKPIRLTSSSLVNDYYFAAYGPCAITAPIHQTGTDPFRIRNEGNSLYGDGILTLSGGGTLAGPVEFGPTNTTLRTVVMEGATDSNRHPSLRLTRSDSFPNARHTVLTMTATTSSSFFTDCGTSREPELILDAGVNAVFKDVILNGRHLAPGTWGGADSSAQHKDDEHFSGSGMITVLGSGMMIIFR